MDFIFSFIFIAVLALAIFNFARGVKQWSDNNKAPLLTVPAKVTAKRQSTTQHNQPNGGDPSGAQGFTVITSTTYYATFEFESGDRLELSLSGSEYGRLAEGDEGKLSFKGTRFISFE